MAGMNRADMVAYISSQLSALQAATGVTATDDAAGYGEALDDALLLEGVAFDDLPTAVVTDHFLPFRDLLYYVGLRKNHRRLLHLLSYSVGSSLSEDQGKLLAQVERNLMDARNVARGHGYEIPDEGGDEPVSYGEIMLDIYEPSAIRDEFGGV